METSQEKETRIKTIVNHVISDCHRKDMGIFNVSRRQIASVADANNLPIFEDDMNDIFIEIGLRAQPQ